MTTTNKKETTRKSSRVSRRSGSSTNNKVESNNINTSIIDVVAPTGAGLSDGVTSAAVSSGSVSVGSSSAAVGRASRMDQRTKLENAVIFDNFKLSLGVRDLSTKLVSFFAVPEWAEKEETEKRLRATFPKWNDEQITAAVAGAAKNAGVDLSAPAVSAARVLAVVRRAGLVREFVSLVGMSFNNIRKHIKEHGLNNYSWRLSVSVVRSNSDIKDFVDIVPVASGASASAVVGALLSLRDFVEYNKRVSAAAASDRSDYNQFISLSVRLAKRLGYDIDRVLYDVKSDFNTCATSDYNQRKQLKKNLASATNTINECNDLILSLGGVTVLESDNVTSKAARGIKSALKRRAVAYSVASTIEKLLDL